MFINQTLARRLPATALAFALAACSLPLAASAQDVPSYAQPVSVSTDETIHGRIASVDGAFSISVSDDRGFVDTVSLHQGTIINPTGLTLSPGMSVTIAGYNAGSVFDANEIDTPYHYGGDLPVPVYYGAGYWYPGFGYGYGPSFTLAFIFGDGGGYGRFEHRGFYGRPWDGRRYFGGYVGHGYGDGVHGGIAVRGDVRGFADRRTVTGENRAVGHEPSAFAGRSFAGHAYSGTADHATYASPGRRYPSGNGYAGGLNRGAATGTYRHTESAGGFAGSRPAGGGGGFARGGGGGVARGGGGAVAHGGGGASHGGGVRH